MLSFLAALALSALLVGMLHVTDAEAMRVWSSFKVSLPQHLGTLLSLVVVTFLGILFGFALGWIAIKCLGVLAIEALRIVTKPAVDTVQKIQGAGSAAARAGGSLVHGAVEGAAAVGNAAAGLVQRGAQLMPGRRPDGAVPEDRNADAKL